jgi:hypothetical protein
MLGASTSWSPLACIGIASKQNSQLLAACIFTIHVFPVLKFPGIASVCEDLSTLIDFLPVLQIE